MSIPIFSRRTLSSGFIILAIGTILGLTLALAFRPLPELFFAPLSEDGYYSFAIARHIGAGRGITFDGVTPTNGFQPMVTFLQAALFYFTDGDDAATIRLYLVVSWLVFILTAWQVGALAAGSFPRDMAKARRARLIGSCLYLCGTYLFLHHFNGLETGLVLLLYSVMGRLLLADAARTVMGAALLGFTGGLLILARIDAAFFIMILASAFWLKAKSWLGLRPHQGLILAMVMGTVSLAVSLPWWWYNWSQFGSPMPISGTAQQLWAVDGERMRWLAWALGTSGFPWLFLGQWESTLSTWLRLPFYGLGLASLWYLMRNAPDRLRLYLGCLLAALLLLGLWYCFSSFAFWFYSRYLAPAAIIGVLAVSHGLAGWRMANPVHAFALVLAALPVSLAAGFSVAGISLYGTIMFWDQVIVTRDHVPALETVAAGQAGTLGFFRSGVVNVDGKVNPDMRDRQGPIADYLKARNIRWFVDWPNYVEQALGPDPASQGWRMVGRRGKFILYHRAED